MAASQYHQFVPAEGKTLRTTVGLSKKLATTFRRMKNTLELEAAKKTRKKRRDGLKRLLHRKGRRFWGQETYVSVLLPVVYRTAALCNQYPEISVGTCWRMALIVEHSERIDFDGDSADNIRVLLESSQFAVYRATRYDPQPSFEMSDNLDNDITKRVDPILKVPAPVIQTLRPAPTPTTSGRKLGSGTYGTVTQMLANGKYFARKYVNDDTTDGVLISCVREISLMRELTGSKHITQLEPWAPHVEYEDGRITSCTFDMELGIGSLKDMKREFNDETKCYKLFIQIASGIQACHDAMIMHRDLKPDNILLFGPPSNRIAKLADFGMARRLSAYPGRTYTCHVVTSWWRAPEIWRGGLRQAVNIRYGLGIDVFSFGIIMCDVFAGKTYTPHVFDKHIKTVPGQFPYGEWPDKWSYKYLSSSKKFQIVYSDNEQEPVAGIGVFASRASAKEEIRLHNEQVDSCWLDFMSRTIQQKAVEDGWPYSVQYCLRPDPKFRPDISEILVRLQLEQQRIRLQAHAREPRRLGNIGRRRRALSPRIPQATRDPVFPKPPNIKLERRAALEARF